MLQMPNSLRADYVTQQSPAQVLIHPSGVVARVPDVDALADQLADRAPGRVWCIATDGTLIVLNPWAHLVLAAIIERWPDAALAHVTSLHDRPAAERRAA